MSAPPAAAVTPADFRRLADIYEDLVDSEVGIIEGVYELPRFPGTPDFFHFFAHACDTGAFVPFSNFNNAGGASVSRDLALAKAIGEAVERYCSAIFDPDELPLTSRAEAPFPCVPPEAFALYSPAQYEEPGFPWAPFDDDTPVRWTPARDPSRGEVVHVPAAMVFIPYYYRAGEAPIAQPISTGLACHTSYAEAAVGGLCEVIERDALTIFWQAMVSPPQILVETLSDANYDRVARFEATGYRVTLLEITTDLGVPTVMSVARAEAAELPALVFAAATAADPEQAVAKALEELAHTRRYCHTIKKWMPRLVPSPPSHDNVVDQVSHLNFWTDQANAHLADFAFASPVRREFDAMASVKTGGPEADLAAICRRIEAVGCRALIADLTTPDVRPLGFSVVHAVVPGLHPLFMGYRNRALGGRRLWEVPARLGLKGRTPREGDNPSPHMYP